MSVVKVKTLGRLLAVQAPISQSNLRLMRAIPNLRKWAGNMVAFDPTPGALDYVKQTFPTAEWAAPAQALVDSLERVRALAPPTLPRERRDSFEFKTQPFAHQLKVFNCSRDKNFFALLMEQGTGKTKVTIDTIAYLWGRGEIRAALIIAPNGVHTNWMRKEIPEHMPDWVRYRMVAWSARKGEKALKPLYDVDNTSQGELLILCVNVEALSTKRGEKVCMDFTSTYPCLMAVDESTSIKNISAKRTKAVFRAAIYAPYRRILTGTPGNPLDYFAQFSFLDEEILGYSSFYAYRARYATLRAIPGRVYHGHPVETVTGFQNLDELRAKVEPFSFRVRKDECLDLPPKMYQREIFQMSEEQAQLYHTLRKQLRESFRAEFAAQYKNGTRQVVVEAQLVITRLLRLHQIACGFVTVQPELDNPTDMLSEPQMVPIGKTNARLERLLSVLENIEGKAIIWGSYTYSLNEIYRAIAAVYGKESIAVYSGKVSQAVRLKGVEDFQNPKSQVRFFLGQQKAAARGLTLTEAGHVIYFNNVFPQSLEIRQQSEDRAHRIGQTKSVLYIDLEAEGTLDRKIIEDLKKQQALNAYLVGDEVLAWLEDDAESEQVVSKAAAATAR